MRKPVEPVVLPDEAEGGILFFVGDILSDSSWSDLKLFQARKSVTVKERARARALRFPIIKRGAAMSSSPVIILTPPATRDSYEYYYYEYDDDGGDQEFGQSKKIERTGQSTSTEAPAAASEVVAAEAAEAADDQAASGLFFGGLFGSDKCPYCDKGGYQKEPCCPHVVDGPWLFLLLGSVALLAIFLQRQVALPLTIRLCLLTLTFFAFCFWLF